MKPVRGRHIHGLTVAALCLFMFLTVFLGILRGTVSGAPEPFSVASVPNVHLADKTRYVSDPDGILSATDTAQIDSRLAALEKGLGVQAAVVVVKDVGDNDAREFATDLFNAWGLGKKGEDNGLLILLVTQPPQRAVIFETGYGLEGVLPDAIAFRLQQRYMVPSFKQGDWGAGLINGVKAVGDYLAAGKEQRSVMAAPVPGEQSSDEGSALSAGFLILGFFLLLFLFRRNPAALGMILGTLLGGRGGRGGGGFGGGGGSWGGGSSGGGGSMSRF